MLIADPDCLACVQCHRVIAKVGTGQAHLVRGGHEGVCCDECRSGEPGKVNDERADTVTDLMAFLHDRLDEDEAAARASGGLKQGDYHWFETDPERPPPGVIGTNSGNIVTYQTELRVHAAHIARHDPERVLREVGAKRAILNAHRITDGRCHVCTAIAGGHATRFRAPCPTLYFLAAVYSDHPDYRRMEDEQEWKP